MGKHDKKKKKKKQQSQQGKGKEKTELKTEKNAIKRALKSKNNDDEEDIEALIAKFKLMDQQKVAINEEIVGWPSPRINATLVVNPLKESELILFGGEFFDGELTFVYNDLFKFNLEKKEWKKISSPNSPPPRCSHQAATYKNWMYIFGGEFTSPSQNQFYHYKDLWRFNLETNTWENLQKEVKGSGPSGRSGHRMVRWKNKMIVFGGFFDTISETRYFNDLYILDLDNLKWSKVEHKLADTIPPARSGFVMGVFADTLYLYGGYSKVKDKSKVYSEAKGVVHTDMYTMNLSTATLKWEKSKRDKFAPTARSGMSMAIDKKRMILFGGVLDVEMDDDIQSTFYQDLYTFHMDTRKWFRMTLHKKAEKKKKKNKPKQQQQQSKSSKEEDNDDEKEEEEDYENEDNENEKQEDNKEKDDDNEDDDQTVTSKKKTQNEVHDLVKLAKNRVGVILEMENSKCKVIDTNGNIQIIKTDEIIENISSKGISTFDANRNQIGIGVGVLITDGNNKGKFGTIIQLYKQHAFLSSQDGVIMSNTQHLSIKSSNTESVTATTIPDITKPLVPSPRINSMMVAANNILYIFGGSYEVNNKEITLNDMYSLNLHKMESFECLKEADQVIWKGEEEEDEETDDEGEEDDESDSSDEETNSEDEDKEDRKNVKKPKKSKSKKPKDEESDEDENDDEDDNSDESNDPEEENTATVITSKKKGKKKKSKKYMDELKDRLSEFEKDGIPTANPNESLKEFYERTKEYWLKLGYEISVSNTSASSSDSAINRHDEKTLRRFGFPEAEKRYNSMKPLLDEFKVLAEESSKQEEIRRKGIKTKGNRQ